MRGLTEEHPHATVLALAVAAFVALTAWWVLADQRLPGGGDPGRHLSSALDFADDLEDLDVVGLVTERADARAQFFYPPLARFVAGVPAAVGLDAQDWGVVLVNLVFVPMLAAGCFLVGRLVYGPLAGLLAAVFALATPMILDLFHVFMLDAPLAAVVALTLWAFLASDRFTRRRESVLAGALLGVGVMVKTTAPIFLFGTVLVMLARGGWRQWRNIALAAAAAIVVAAPWHVIHAGDITNLSGQAPGGLGPAGLGGEQISATSDFLTRLTDYFWVGVNLQYFLPLALLFAVGVVFALRELRSRPHLPELFAGMVFAFLFFAFAISLRDPRYTLPLVVFVAVIATGWIAMTRSSALRGAGIGVLAVAVVLNVAASAGSGVGTERISLPGDDPNLGYRAQPGTVTVVDDTGYIGGPPQEDPFWTELFDAAEADGLRTAEVRIRDASELGADHLGFLVLARQAGMRETTFAEHRPEHPDLRVNAWRGPDEYWVGEVGLPAPCARVPDGVPPSPLAVAVERYEDGRYRRWCDFLSAD